MLKVNKKLRKIPIIFRKYIPNSMHKLCKDFGADKSSDIYKRVNINFSTIVPSIIDPTIGTLQLNNSKNYNCLSAKLITQLIQQLDHYDMNNNIKSIILNSNDKDIFSFGLDYKRIFKRNILLVKG